jgi:hypothetical protein
MKSHTGCCDSHIVVLLDGGAQQLLQLLVLKKLPPFLVRERSRIGLPGILLLNSSMSGRNIYRRALVTRPHGATRKEKR